MLGHADGALPGALGRGDIDMLGPDADGRRPMLRRDRPFDQVHLRRADEARDERVARRAVQLQRRADLLDIARAQHHDLVGHGHRFDLVVVT
jgi:hypothetical protein